MSQESIADSKDVSLPESKDVEDGKLIKNDTKILKQPLKEPENLLLQHIVESLDSGVELPKSTVAIDVAAAAGSLVEPLFALNIGEMADMRNEDFMEFVKKGINGSIVDVFNQLIKTADMKKITPPVDIVDTETAKYTYVVFQEVNESETESWQYFIRWEGNEDEIQHLHKIIQSIDWIPIEECSIFYSNIENRVSEQTAKEMSRLDFGSKWRNRKFDGKLERINFGFKKRDRTIEKMHKIFDHIGYGQIEDYVGDEDYSDDSDDDSDYSDHEDSSSDEESEKHESKSKESSDDDSESDTEKTTPPTRSQGIPPSLLSKNLPRSAKHRRR